MKKILLSLAIVLMAFAATWATTGPGLGIGDVAPDFKLRNVDGKMVGLADYASAKGFIVIFTCNHCPFSVAYEDRIIELQKTFGPQGYPVIAINPNDPAAQSEDSFDHMVTRAREKGFNFPYLFDEGQKIYPQYGATRTPHVYLLDRERVVRYIGAIDDNFSDAAAVQKTYLADAVRALQNGGKPDPDVTKAVGCTIKVKK
jgi:peroxiredoxin